MLVQGHGLPTSSEQGPCLNECVCWDVVLVTTTAAALQLGGREEDSSGRSYVTFLPT